MERKNEKVAALLSIYCDNVGNAPRGPAPPLESVTNHSVSVLVLSLSLGFGHNPSHSSAIEVPRGGRDR